MTILRSAQVWEKSQEWQRQGGMILERIHHLIREIQREPFSGIGEPKPLHYALRGYWSRRITEEHRLVYKIQDDTLLIAHHYGRCPG